VYQLATQLPPCPRASRSLTTGQSYKGIRVSDRVTDLAHVSGASAAVGAAVLAGLRDGQPLQRLAAQLVEEIVLLVLGLGRRRRLRVRLAVLMVEGSGPSSSSEVWSVLSVSGSGAEAGPQPHHGAHAKLEVVCQSTGGFRRESDCWRTQSLESGCCSCSSLHVRMRSQSSHVEVKNRKENRLGAAGHTCSCWTSALLNFASASSKSKSAFGMSAGRTADCETAREEAQKGGPKVLMTPAHAGW